MLFLFVLDVFYNCMLTILLYKSKYLINKIQITS